MQTRSFRQKIIDAATADGSLGDLFWIVEFTAPARSLPATLRQAQRPAGELAEPTVTFAASSPNKWIPAIPVAPDPIISQHYAEIMLELFKANNPGGGREWTLALTTVDLLRGGYHWYEFGETLPVVDHVCPICCAIIRRPAGEQITTCMGVCG